MVKTYKVVDYPNGDYTWYWEGNLHREGGPARRQGGREEWFKHGKLHREDGPAVENEAGYKSYWLEGKELTAKQFGDRQDSLHGEIIEIKGKKYRLEVV